ncbi:hypothetical protein [Ruegeria haliotis]|uniref:hypothetical protein n=1 Tax=Ruegeria haliotis TaxID=2747601 RepID=UPI0038B47500
MKQWQTEVATLEYGTADRPETTVVSQTGLGQSYHLEFAGTLRSLALFNLAGDSKLRGCDLVCLKVPDLVKHDRARERASISS